MGSLADVTRPPVPAGTVTPDVAAEQPGEAETAVEGNPTRTGLSGWALAGITAVVTLPMLWLGYGTDLDIESVREAGETIRSGDYFPSRNPGVPTFETVVGLLDPVGGHIAVNLATAAAAAAAVVGIARLVRAWDRPNGDLVALAFLVSPITLIAATSTTDFIWAAALFVWAALAHLRDRSALAGVLFALAIGSRSSTVLLVAAFLVADGWAPAHRWRSLRTAAVMVPLAAALYVPAWLAFDRSFEFLAATDGWRGLANNLGRFAFKNYTVAGVALVVVAAVALPALVRTLRRWRDDSMVRFAVLGFAVAQALFLQLPWKPAHLLPALLTFVLWVAASERNRRPFLALLIAAIAVNGLVTFRPFTPDEPDLSRRARFDPAITAGLVVNDLDCRAQFMHEDPELTSGAWACTLEPMRGPVADSGGPGAEGG